MKIGGGGIAVIVAGSLCLDSKSILSVWLFASFSSFENNEKQFLET